MFFGRFTVLWTSTFLVVSVLQAQALKKTESIPGEYLVKLSSQYSVETSDIKSLEIQLDSEIKTTIPELNIVVVKRPKIETEEFAVRNLSNISGVDFAEPNYIYRVETTPNDPMFGNLWGLKNIGQSDSEGSAGAPGIDLEVERAWEIETGSDKTLIAVIDTGIDYNHPDLKDNVWINSAEANGRPGIDDDNNGIVDDIYGANFSGATPTGNPMDDHGHGSHCSGTIGARGNDGKGIVGVNWNTRIMAVKFLGADGGGSLEGAVKAITYATKMGAKILSNSWGGGGYSEALKLAISESHKAGALFVAAAGNDSSSNDTGDHYPSNYDVPNVISVAAVDNKGLLATFSNYGKKVHVAAPGVNIYSSLPGGKYDSWSGTSMATPHVTGVAGLLLSHEPRLTNLELKNRIISTVKPLSTIHNKVQSGGLVNAANALMNVIPPPDPNDPSNWKTKSVSIATPHPYKPKAKYEFEVSLEGAQEIALYFQTFDSEKNYDKLSIFNKDGVKVSEISGSNDDSFSIAIKGSYARLVFTSDDSVEKQGFEITKIAYR